MEQRFQRSVDAGNALGMIQLYAQMEENWSNFFESDFCQVPQFPISSFNEVRIVHNVCRRLLTICRRRWRIIQLPLYNYEAMDHYYFVYFE